MILRRSFNSSFNSLRTLPLLSTSKMFSAPSSASFANASEKAPRFGIVGSGPAGMHVSKQILKDIPNSYVDMYDKMPFPFGLVRTGVAPDHQDVKKVIKEFTKVAESKRFKFYGNVNVGTDIPLKTLRSSYSGLILAYGAEGDRKLRLEGEETLKGIYSARSIVNWYNSHIEHNYLDDHLFTEHKMKNIVLIGNGNVAIDVARIFSKRIDELKVTDINEKTLELREKNPTENIFIVGRRGAIQAAFTTKTLREIVNMQDVEVYIMKEDIDKSLNEASVQEHTDPLDFRFRANKRKFELLKTVKILENEEELNKILQTKPKGCRIIFRFLLSPTKLIGEEGKIKKMEFCRNILKGPAYNQSASRDETEPITTIDCDVLMRSIGYQSKPIEDVIFDSKNHIIPNSNGCVLSEHNPELVEVGLYVTGWVKTGPVGVIDTTLKDSVETFINLKQHFLKGILPEKDDPQQVIEEHLKGKGINFTTFQDWKKVNEAELQGGETRKKVREKVKTLDEFFKIARN